MAESIYSYINKFPIIVSRIEEKGNGTNHTIKGQCDKFQSSNPGILKDSGDKFSKECWKIAQYQDEIINDDNSYKPALCKYINYWFYGTLKKEKQSNHYSLLSDFYKKVKSLEYCNAYLKQFKTGGYDEVKELYEMYDIFEKFKKESSKPTNPTCKDLTECFTIYDKYLKKCETEYKHGLCMNVKNFKYEYDDHREIEKKCVGNMKELDTLRTDLESIILLPFVIMTLITFILVYLYKFTSFGSWLRPRLPGGKNKAKKLLRRMQEFQDTSEPGRRPYKLSYHFS
ncbi:PIR protein [Plasmodium vivax]|uniref:VIR protein n=1 Tax=Plasmodium vivax TaxID=5855 RepID=A0A565A604_PLAVI|nr:PIR protein [Plasmodium vivax]